MIKVVAGRVQPNPELVRRLNGLADLWNNYDIEHAGDPDEDAGFVSAARHLMGLPPTPIQPD